MEDHEIIARIGDLAEEEQRLEEQHVGEGLSDDDQARLNPLRSRSTECGIFSGSVAPCETPVGVPTRPPSDRRALLKGTASRGSMDGAGRGEAPSYCGSLHTGI